MKIAMTAKIQRATMMVLVIWFGLSGSLALAAVAGQFQFVSGDVRVQRAGQTLAATKGIDFIPRQVAAPTADTITRRAASAAGQACEPRILHLVQMKDAFQARHQAKRAGQRHIWKKVLARSDINSTGYPGNSR